ncbi:MAG TPA: hypothetical protein VHM20_07740 [Gammaproteobacteria bacterium]|jgi:hypothetical protein|nr:hypothetical protein [Gammaproteobacteria bacterium]
MKKMINSLVFSVLCISHFCFAADQISFLCPTVAQLVPNNDCGNEYIATTPDGALWKGTTQGGICTKGINRLESSVVSFSPGYDTCGNINGQNIGMDCFYSIPDSANTLEMSIFTNFPNGKNCQPCTPYQSTNCNGDPEVCKVTCDPA